ncbi:MAG: hypothetical protein SGCHY_003381 [Lobulomycetales sp.]
MGDKLQQTFRSDGGAAYWKEVESTVDGMLGGFQQLDEPDVRGSNDFIRPFLDSLPARNLACDCGAGIGRVSKNFLLQHFKQVDLVEQNKSFLETARETVFGPNDTRVSRYIPLGLQDFTPEPARYDLIWCQLALATSGGRIGVKENVLKALYEEETVFDEEDCSVTRSDALLKRIFAESGLRLLAEDTQTGFPQGLYRVKMYWLE